MSTPATSPAIATNKAAAKAKASARMTNLDLLRLVSALMVVAVHYGFRMNITGEGGSVKFPEFASITVWFQAAIFLFFMISGYVVSMSASGRTGKHFFVTRAARVWPTFFACATITAIVLSFLPVPGQAEPTIAQWIAHAAIVSRLFGQPFLDGAYWTIVYELVFYIWVYLLLVTRLFDKHWREVVLAWLVISIANEFFIGSSVMEKLFITKYSGCFLFGWVLYHHQKSTSRNTLGLLMIMAVWATISPILNEPQITMFYGIQRDWLTLSMLGALCAVVMVVATTLPSIPLNAERITAITAVTYPVYLLHQNVGYAIFNHFGEGLGRWLSLALALTVVAGTSYFVAHHLEPFCRPRLQRLLEYVTASRSRQTILKPA